MFCGIHSSCKMYLAVHHCLRSTAMRNSQIFSCQKFKYLHRALRPASLTRFSCDAIKTRTSCYEKWRSHVTLSRQQFVCPVVCDSLCRNFSGNPLTEKKEDGKSEKKLSAYQRLKKMYKEYWYVLVPVHIFTSCIWFGSFYYLAVSGIDIPALLQSLGAPESWIENLEKSKAGNVFLAYTLYKVASPLRYTVTIGGTTIAINYLKKWGYIKPVPNKEQIRQMYQEQKGVFKDFKATCQDKMQVTKNEFLKTKNEMQRQLHEAKVEFHNTISETRADIKTTVREGSEEFKDLTKNVKREIKRSFREKIK